ncbi:hypothetical protein FQA47_010868 [Oryzias melastigma]|uniref:Uncharacterized protein n=1 Tax=Oryzias melastigma TaxID=30732 RepID=A0A834CT32_ORYME|nr:hypothetical protein FQA47_010868 [Oryzias melastigma]
MLSCWDKEEDEECEAQNDRGDVYLTARTTDREECLCERWYQRRQVVPVSPQRGGWKALLVGELSVVFLQLNCWCSSAFSSAENESVHLLELIPAGNDRMEPVTHQCHVSVFESVGNAASASDCSVCVRMQRLCQTAASVSECSVCVRLQRLRQTAASASDCSVCIVCVRLQRLRQNVTSASECRVCVRLQRLRQTVASASDCSVCVRMQRLRENVASASDCSVCVRLQRLCQNAASASDCSVCVRM